MGIEMVKDKDIPYLRIVGHMLTTIPGDQEVYIGAVSLIVYDGY